MVITTEILSFIIELLGLIFLFIPAYYSIKIGRLTKGLDGWDIIGAAMILLIIRRSIMIALLLFPLEFVNTSSINIIISFLFLAITILFMIGFRSICKSIEKISYKKK